MIDWDAMVLGPVMAVFGEGSADPTLAPTFTPAGGGASTPLPDAVFDEAYQVLMAGEENAPPVNTTLPVLGVRRAILPAEPQQGDFIAVPRVATRYRIRDVRPDGHGHLLLLLNYAGPA